MPMCKIDFIFQFVLFIEQWWWQPEQSIAKQALDLS